MAEATETVDEKQEQQEDSKKQAKTVELSEASETDGQGASTSIDVLLDMDVTVTAVIDKTEITVQRLLQLGPGSVLKLDRPVGAPVDLYLRNVKFATAAVVVIDDCFAVRIKEILSPATIPGSAEA